VPHAEPTEDTETDPKTTLYKKVVPLALLFFFSSFNLTILQALKDAIVVTTSGAEALPFLAALVVLPASVGFLAYYTKLLNVMPRKQVYYAALLPFVAFYGLFATVLYPLSDTLHLHGLFDKVSVNHLGKLLKGAAGCESQGLGCCRFLHM
jgi:ATP:ADP antiporter, AAA family